MPSGGAVAIVDNFNEVAATDGLLVVTDIDPHIIGGLVDEVVHTRKPSLAEVMRLAVKAHPEVVDTVGAPPFHAAPGLAKCRASIAYVEHDLLVGLYGLI